MKLKIIRIIVEVAIVAYAISMTALYRGSQSRVKEQSVIIDSLLNRRMTVFDVQLNVTDKSTNKINGTYNKGTISMPQERVYKLEIDSVNVTVK
jgi:hypothetical protein